MITPAGLLSRVVAKVIDLIVATIAVELLQKTGFFAGLVYILVSDGFFNGRSPGKMLLGLSVVRADGKPCTVKESILRNMTVALGFLLWRIPLIGWLLFLCVLAFEFIVLFGSDTNRRLGDEIAKTSVIEVPGSREETANNN